MTSNCTAFKFLTPNASPSDRPPLIPPALQCNILGPQDLRFPTTMFPASLGPYVFSNPAEIHCISSARTLTSLCDTSIPTLPPSECQLSTDSSPALKLQNVAGEKPRKDADWSEFKSVTAPAVRPSFYISYGVSLLPTSSLPYPPFSNHTSLRR